MMPRPGWTAGAVAALMALAACSPAPGGTSPSSSSAPPGAAAPGEVYGDQQLVELATTVVRSRNLRGLVDDTRNLRETAKVATPSASTGVTRPEQCAAFRLHEETETAIRRTAPDVSFAEGRMPLTGQSSQTTTILFVIRSAPHDKLAAADFNKTDALAAECAHFERSYTYSMAGGTMSATYEAQLLTAPPVGQQAYATTQKAKGLGPKDIGTAGLQVLAGTVSIDMALTVWPVNSETTARAVDSMAGFARDLIDEAVKNPPGAPQPNPAGARSPEELTQLLKGVKGGAGRELYVTPTEARAVTRASGASPLPSRASCAYDDAAYYGALAAGATMAQAIVSTGDKLLSLDASIISMGSAVTQPYPFDTRTSAISGCTSIQANVLGQGQLSWSAVQPLAVQLDADSSHAFRYQAPDGSGRSYVRLGARKGTLSVEASTMTYRPLAEGEVQAAVDAATTVIEQVFAKAGV
ncbi:hypothetical protein [Arthrobacter sp. U41]|uniref:hypothetical protein n=1 Tax=Arthrobacter sp. U41 TaxID=1849032 RepID=UPI0012F82653|nr:hypothetical protein [Arthrobacter sp. U41]